MLEGFKKFIIFWYLRYLMITELYMVEKWERHVAHGAMIMFFVMLYFFNTKLFLPTVSSIFGMNPATVELPLA